MCYYCDSPADNAEHALFMCAKWGATREALGQAVGADLTHETMVPVILQSERFWRSSSHLLHLWWGRESSMGVGSETTERASKIASGPAPVVLRLGWTWLSASFGEGISLFLPWLAWLVGLPNGRVTAGGSSARTDDGKVVHDLKLEPTTREVWSQKAVPRAVYWFKRRGFWF